MDSLVSDDPPLSSDDILAAYKAKKENSKEKEAKPDDVMDLFGSKPPRSEPEPASEPESEPESRAETTPEPEASAPEPEPSGPDIVSEPTTAAPEPSEPEAQAVTPEPAPLEDAVLEHPETKQIVEQKIAPSALIATEPSLRLSERIYADTLVMVRGNRKGRLIAGGVAVFFLALLVMERALARAADIQAYTAAGMPLHVLLWIFIFIAAGVSAGFLFYPPERKVGVQLLSDQQEEWERVQGEAQLLRLLWYVGLGMIGGGGFILVLSFSVIPDGGLGLALAIGFLAFLGGLGVTGYAWARQSAIHRLYIQTMVLSRLEQTGLGPGTGHDPRTAPVLKALDGLLGALPESRVRAFLASDEARLYLEMIDELDEEK